MTGEGDLLALEPIASTDRFALNLVRFKKPSSKPQFHLPAEIDIGTDKSRHVSGQVCALLRAQGSRRKGRRINRALKGVGGSVGEMMGNFC